MFLDTSGLLCHLYRSEPQHLQAVRLLDTASQKLLTHSYVLAELFALASSPGVPKASSLAYAIGLIENPSIDIIWVGKALHEAALGLISNRTDKGYSLCDAVSFVLMKQQGVTQALTTDRHFEQEGFVKLL